MKMLRGGGTTLSSAIEMFFWTGFAIHQFIESVFRFSWNQFFRENEDFKSRFLKNASILASGILFPQHFIGYFRLRSSYTRQYSQKCQ